MDDIYLKQTTKQMADYADRHEIFKLFSDMVTKCVLSRPEDVITFLIDYLKCPRECIFI